ncbi:hypothetical protein GCM10023115_46550 [Pontixanthobacter gangjinensis]|uniref:Dienelactone hydrolase domain-containing protein n=1 Tax=Christiangramia aestuarii TaxID=1028746 RepID=A0A7M3SXC2_9FLAO|nr:dienelactone hydrolase family protein [Christiangramia aestuarii]MUP41253.1 hypothetical protein [Christiangramia aestuarii]
MKKLVFRSILVVLITFFSISCSSDDNDSPSTPDRTSADVEADFQALDLTTGVNDVSLQSVEGRTWNFRLIIPESAGTSERPLILTLHGASGGNPDAHKSTACYTEPGFEAIDPIILSPNGGNNLWTDAVNQQMILSLLFLVNKYQNVNEDRVVVTGYSNGGNGAWFYAEVVQGLFSASIPMVSSYNTYSTAGTPRQINIPLYVIHGENDELFPLAETQEWVEATRSAGTDVTMEVAPGLGHYEPCEYVPYVKNAVEWLQNDVWN